MKDAAPERYTLEIDYGSNGDNTRLGMDVQGEDKRKRGQSTMTTKAREVKDESELDGIPELSLLFSLSLSLASLLGCCPLDRGEQGCVFFYYFFLLSNFGIVTALRPPEP